MFLLFVGRYSFVKISCIRLFTTNILFLGANLDIADKLGKTAYDYAKVTNKNNVLQLLQYTKEQKLDTKPMANTNGMIFFLISVFCIY